MEREGRGIDAPGQRIEVDVLVAGGGTAGCAAAIAAARRGHRVLLVEESNALGGTSTTGGVSTWFAHTVGLGDIFDRQRDLLDEAGARKGREFGPEYLKIAWQVLVEESGADILLHASVAGAEIDDGAIVRATVVSCSRRIEVGARWFVDATGEGDLAFLAGAEFLKGHPDTGRTLQMSLIGMLVDTGKSVEPWLPPGIAPIRDEGDLPGRKVRIPLPDGRILVNMTKIIGRDPTDPWDLTRAELEARRQLVRVVHWLQRTQYPTYVLASSGARIGIREGRRVTGDYVLSEREIAGESGGADFPDGIAVATAWIDFHSITKPGMAGRQEWVKPYAIPFRCLTAKGFRNLLVAGKCASGDQVAQSSFRMTPTCCAMGQAAGTAVALASEIGAHDVRDVPIDRLRAELTAAGMELDPRKHEPFPPREPQFVRINSESVRSE